MLSLLLVARDEDGSGFSDEEVRDQLMTLMFAGHDTSTSTLSFLLLRARPRPRGARPAAGRAGRGARRRGRRRRRSSRGELPYLEMVVDEVLRLYPPAWIGPRRAVHDFEFAGCTVPAGAHVNYCSWASHRLPEVFPDPEAFIPERFTRERKAALPRGAYVPFGGGSRICIGKRFGQTEVKLVATMALQRLRFERLPGRSMTIRQMPTLSPDGGLEMRVRERVPLLSTKSLDKGAEAMLNGNGALDTSTHRLFGRVRDELSAGRFEILADAVGEHEVRAVRSTHRPSPPRRSALRPPARDRPASPAKRGRRMSPAVAEPPTDELRALVPAAEPTPPALDADFIALAAAVRRHQLAAGHRAVPTRPADHALYRLLNELDARLS